MNSPERIKRKIALASKSLGIELLEHTVEQVEHANKYFDNLRAQSGSDEEFYQRLTPTQAQYIKNERVLCQIDFRYWATRYHFIKNIHEQIIRIVFNVAQLIVLAILGQLSDEGRVRFLQSLKARQVGITTIAQAIIQWLVQFHRNKNAIVGSSDPRKSAEMVEKFFISWELQPFWLRPRSAAHKDGIDNYKTGEWYKFVNKSTLWVQHGSQLTDIGRGTTPNAAHLSECADYDKPEQLIDAGLLKSLHETPESFFIAESTAKGNSGWWFDTWWDNKKYWDVGEAKMFPSFIPWYVASDLYPTETWLRSHNWYEVKDTWQPEDFVQKHAEKARNFVHSYPLLRQFLGGNWEMPREQMYFYQLEYKRHQRKKILHIFFSEMPADDLEAFQSLKMSVFDAELLAKYRNSVKEPMGVYQIRGKDIPQEFHPKKSEIYINEEGKTEVFRVKVEWTHSLPPFEFEFVRIKFRGYSNCDPQNKFFLWEKPEQDNIYAVGFDSSDGLGVDRSDNSVIEVFRQGDTRRCDAQVGEFVSASLSGAALWPFSLAVGGLFSVLRQGKVKQPLAIPEINREGGQILWKELKLRGWKEVYREIRKSSVRRGVPSYTEGWRMSAINRVDLVQWGENGLNDEQIEINSPWFIDEMGSFIKHEDGKHAAAKCFPFNTKILLKNGSIKPISMLLSSESVVTHKGRSKKVDDGMKREYKGRMVQLKVSGLPELIEATPEHPFLAKRRKRWQLQTIANRKTPQTEWIKAGELKSGDWVALPKRRGLKLVDLSAEQLYAIGFWLAEGHFWYGRQKDCLGIGLSNSEPKLIRRVDATLRAWFPVHKIRQKSKYKEWFREVDSHSRLYKCKRKAEERYKDMYDYTFNSSFAGDFFKRFGNHCSDKHLPDGLYDHSGLLPLVEGFIDGDGSQRRGGDQDVNIYTTSEQLVWQMRQILIDNGVWCTLRCTRRRVYENSFASKVRPMWILNIKASFLHLLKNCKVVVPEKRFTRHVIEDEDYFFAPVRKISERDFEGEVYNVSVAEDDSYTAGGVAVHNCKHDDRLVGLWLPFRVLYLDDARDSGVNPFVERKREVPESEKYPLYTDGLLSGEAVSPILEKMIRRGEYPY